MANQPKTMSAADFEAHRKAALAEHARNARIDADPRAAIIALEEKVAELSAKVDRVPDAKPTPAVRPAKKASR